jgi:5-methylcytosine-specific restriction protein A
MNTSSEQSFHLRNRKNCLNYRDHRNYVLNRYRLATQDRFRGNEIAELLTRSFPDEIRSTISSANEEAGIDYIVKGSAGKGQWNHCPWVAIFDPIFPVSPQRGYYPVYLFREDMRGVYLSLNQGVTDVREQYKSKRKAALRARAADYRSRLGTSTNGFSDIQIDLAPASRGSLSADYEAGNIVAKYYAAEDLPDEKSLRVDLFQILALYQQLSFSTSADGKIGLEQEDLNCEFIEDYTAFCFHRRIERSPALAKAVKKVHGYTCEACRINFAKLYPGIKKNRYIEAHHLTPIANLKGQKLLRNPKTDFAVLCANCHRMIHRFSAPGDLEAFRKTLDLAGLKVVARK